MDIDFAGRRTGSIWAVLRPDYLTLSIEDQTVVVKCEGCIIYACHSGTGEILRPTPVVPHHRDHSRLDEWGIPSDDD